jgi:hypothetical protein
MTLPAFPNYTTAEWTHLLADMAVKEFREEDHPRDAHGRFGSGGGVAHNSPPKTFAYFHGTSSEAAKAILKEGLIPGKGHGSDAWLLDDSTKNGYMVSQYVLGENGRSASVFMEKDPDEARKFAKLAAEVTHSYPVLLKIAIPKDVQQKLVKDEQFDGAGAYRFEGTIKPEWISVPKTFGSDPAGQEGSAIIDGVEHIRFRKDDSLDIYVVVLADQPEESKSNPNHEPAGSPTGGQFSSGDGGGGSPEPWTMTRRQYAASEWTPDETEAQARERYLKNGEWDQSMIAAVSLGKITPEDADARGSIENTAKWKPLPETLYHATTALDKVEAGGLKTRWDLSQGSGAGLGGGNDKTVSFTESPQTAQAIADALVEAHNVAAGTKTVSDMLQEAKDGTGAPVAFYNKIMEQSQRDWKQGDPVPIEIDDALRGVTTQTGLFGPPDTTHTWSPSPHTTGWLGGDGQMHYYMYERPSDASEKMDANFRLYQTFSFWRDAVGGKLDPLFFLSDHNALAKMDVSQVGVVQVRPASSAARGTQESALGEWRTGTGKAVVIVGRAPHVDLPTFDRNRKQIEPPVSIEGYRGVIDDAVAEFRVRHKLPAGPADVTGIKSNPNHDDLDDDDLPALDDDYKYFPDQSRDDHGRFSDGGGGTNQVASIEHTPYTDGPWVQEAKLKAEAKIAIDSVTRQLGFPADKIDMYDFPGPGMNIGDRDNTEAGDWNPATGRISLFPLTGGGSPGVIAHEIEHAKFGEVSKLYFDASHALSSADYKILDKYLSDKATGKLATDGHDVSSYSNLYWTQYFNAGKTPLSAISETLGEIARIHIETGKVVGGPSMRGLYKAVNRIYAARHPK